MEAKELFSAAMRVIGLLSIGRGAYDLIYVIMYEIGSGDFSVNARFPDNDLVLGIFFFFAGLYLLRGAPLVVDYAFPVRPSYKGPILEEESSSDEDSN
jgi:hypothetical protein